MRLKTIAILLALLVQLGVGSAEAGRKFTDPGSHRHNFSKNSGLLQAVTETRICIFCHTPHGASSQSTLWNRKSPDDPGGAGAAYKLYNEVDNTNGNIISIDDIPAAQYSNADHNAYPNGSSRLCLSCHDGVSAVGDVLVGGPIAMDYNTLTAYKNSGISDRNKFVLDMTRSHPISFVYDTTVVTELVNTFGKTSYQLPTDSTMRDSQKRMQCTACHDPHDDTRTGTYSLPFWRKYTGTADPTDYEATCSECHIGGSSSTTRKPNIGGNHNL